MLHPEAGLLQCFHLAYSFCIRYAMFDNGRILQLLNSSGVHIIPYCAAGHHQLPAIF